MKRIIIPLSLLLIAWISASCFRKVKEIDPEEMSRQPVLVSFLHTGDSIRVFVGHTFGVFEYPQSQDDIVINNARVRLYRDGTPLDTLYGTQGFFYVFPYIPQAGSLYKIEVDVPGGGTMWGETRMPDSLGIRLIGFEKTHQTFNDIIRTDFVIHDPPGEQYYFVNTLSGDKGAYLVPDESLTAEPSKELYQYPVEILLFPDRTFNGRTKNLRVFFNDYSYEENTSDTLYYIFRYGVTDEVYHRYVKFITVNNGDSTPFGSMEFEDMNGNVHGGLGYVSFLAFRTDTLTDN